MIQELMFGGSSSSSSSTTLSAYSTGGGEGKALINNNGGMVAEATKNPSDSSNDGNKCNLEQNLRCPRCDSSNTKFCYYNNYNLTQPRHFCKTCRRYWTKGGALRNVPIGGGCRKNKNSFTTVLPTASKSFTGKHKPYSSSADILLKTGLGNLGLLDPQDSPLHHPVLWPSPPHPHTSHLLAFLRSTQNLNPSNHHLQNSYQAASGFPAMNLLNGQTPLSGLDYHSSSFLRNNSQTLAQHQQVHHQHNEVAQQLGRVDQNSGIQQLYQRLKLSTNSNANSCSSGGNEHSHAHMFLGNGVSATSSPTSTRPGPESATVSVGGGSDSGLWNIPAAAYSTWTNDQLPAATNGADGCHF